MRLDILVPAIAVAGLFGWFIWLSTPDPKIVATLEHPGPAVKPLATALPVLRVKGLPTTVSKRLVAHPMSDCPAPDRGFNPEYAKAAMKHARGDRDMACRVHALAEVESNQNPTARSPAGAQGIIQCMPRTCEELGIDPWQVPEAVGGAVRYLVWLHKRFPHVVTEEVLMFVLAAYNWGVGNVRRTGCTTWACLKPRLPEETRTYVARIMRMMEDGTWYRVPRM